LAGWVNIKVGDLLLTAMVVLAACMLLGILSPRKPWRWVLLVGVFVPVVEWLAYFFLSQKPERAQIYESFLAFVPGIAGAFGGAMGGAWWTTCRGEVSGPSFYRPLACQIDPGD